MNRTRVLSLLLRLYLTAALLLPVVPAESWAAAPDQPVTIKLSFMGDCIIGSEEKSRKLPESFDSMVAYKGYAWPFSGVKHLLDTDDLSIVNFEGVLKDDARHKAQKRLHWFRGPTEFAQVLTQGGVELAGLANNHARDYGIQGLRSTRNALNGAGIPTFGYGELYVYEKDGVRIGFGGIRETTWRQKKQLPAEEIAQLKAQGCDYIVYTIHAGKEYDRQQNKLQQTMARAIVDAGADLVVGAHPHVVQGMERYGRGIILYSLGNFVFGGNLKLTAFEGILLQVELRFAGNALRGTALNLIPVLTTGARPDNDFRPIPAQGEDKAAILRQVQAASSGLTISERMHFPAAEAVAALP